MSDDAVSTATLLGYRVYVNDAPEGMVSMNVVEGGRGRGKEKHRDRDTDRETNTRQKQR